MRRELTCIVCPTGCRITVCDQDGTLSISGQACERGKEYAFCEHTDPKRILTTTIMIGNGTKPRLPVVSDGEIPKAKIRECLQKLYQMNVTAPVRAGQLIMADICGTGVDIIAARSMEVDNG